MERKLWLNWQVLVEEAKQRRKILDLTQEQLANMADVSTPTISRFEQGNKDIQLSSIFQIFSVLGLLDKRTLIFPEKNLRFDFDRELVMFDGQDGEKKIRCEITREALEDRYRSKHKQSLKIFEDNRSAIEQLARKKYLANQFEDHLLIRITSNDF